MNKTFQSVHKQSCRSHNRHAHHSCAALCCNIVLTAAPEGRPAPPPLLGFVRMSLRFVSPSPAKKPLFLNFSLVCPEPVLTNICFGFQYKWLINEGVFFAP